MSDWQPIETCPRFGVRVLMAIPEGSGSSLVQIGWFNRWDEPCFQGLAHNPIPTHWMRLPEPPEQSS